MDPDLEISPQESVARLKAEQPPLLLDVRRDWENRFAAIPGSKLIPLDQLPSRMSEIEAPNGILVYCHHGMRSYHAAQLLQHAGFQARSISGGIDLWSEIIDSSIPRY